MKDENWDDLRLFLHVAREGGLAGAAEKTGISPPTIGRRMLALERATGRALFIRAKTGYELAPDGHVLFDRVQGMQAAARSISDWREQVLSLPIVRIISDSALSRFIGEQLPALWTPDDPFRMCFKTKDNGIDLTYREADIAVCIQKPQAGNVAARKSVAVAYAPYRAVELRFRPLWQLGLPRHRRREPAVDAMGFRATRSVDHHLGEYASHAVRCHSRGCGGRHPALLHRRQRSEDSSARGRLSRSFVIPRGSFCMTMNDTGARCAKSPIGLPFCCRCMPIFSRALGTPSEGVPAIPLAKHFARV